MWVMPAFHPAKPCTLISSDSESGHEVILGNWRSDLFLGLKPMLPRRGLCLSAIAIPPVFPESPQAVFPGQLRHGGTVTPDLIHECESGLWDGFQSPVVSGTSRSKRPCD